ncbi:PREDICTED: uncharacterized protein LOC109470541 [Branchiostoma belcheri]|uniref:Uncharacterized protein LOC109470541 n=1 Tax=Branchiostoma belcheri TaxID=7741 RepID=A0A6P4YTI3_BRABE|nr:PREDICTED: uncharacterized protein LOC109470541 [Branchiostoma belcheri]
MAEDKDNPPEATPGPDPGEDTDPGGETNAGDRQTVDDLPVGEEELNGGAEAITTPPPVPEITSSDRGVSPPTFTVTEEDANSNGFYTDAGVGEDHELRLGNGGEFPFPEVSEGLSRKVSSAGSVSSTGSSSESSRAESRVDLSHLWVPDPEEQAERDGNGRNVAGWDTKKRVEARKKLMSIRTSQEEDTMDSIRKRLVEVNDMVSSRGFVLHTLDKMGDSKRALVHQLEDLHPRDFKKMYTSHLKGLARFRHAVEILMILVSCSRFRRRYHTDKVADSGMPQAASEDTSFSSKNYSNKSSIGWELEMHLTTPPEIRSQDQIKKIVRYLKSTKPFSVFPTDMENEVARCVAYERYDNGRVIAFQQRKPDRFYYILTGRINLVRLYQFSSSSDVAKSMGFLAKGKNSNTEEMETQCPGEYTMVCKGQVEVLLIEREYYFYLQNVQSEPPIDFLRSLNLFRDFPCELFLDNKESVIQRYYGKDKLILKENAETQWMYIVKSGKCKLVRRQSVESANNSHLFRGKRPEDVACGRPFSHADAMMSHQLQAKRKTMWPLYTPTYSFEDELLEAMKDPFLTSFTTNINSRHRDRVRKPRGRIHLPPLRHPLTPPGSDGTSARSRRSEVGRSRVGRLSHTDGDIQVFLQDTVGNVTDSPSSVRHAYLQLGFVGPGEIFGTADLLKNYKDPDDEYKDEVQSVSLVSDGAELVLINKRFFLKYASNQALMKIQAAHSDVVSPDTATESLTQQDTWGQYKKVVMKKLMSPNGVLFRSSQS